jgi:DNA-binding LacI/PurR family transcriptional regulator
MIAGPHDTPGGKFRLVGFQEEMGDDFDPALVEEGDYSQESGAVAMARLLERTRDIDAVFAASDMMAAGAIATLRKAGLRVPEDIAVAGFDDSGLAATHEPALTTMRQPWERLSTEMVSTLLEAIGGAHPAPITLPTTLVIRESA